MTLYNVILAFILGTPYVFLGLRRGFPVSMVGWAVFLSYAFGVLNERAFPGDRGVPADGEAGYWIIVIALAALAEIAAYGAYASGRKS